MSYCIIYAKWPIPKKKGGWGGGGWGEGGEG